jgi:hypothetical protein
LPNFTRVDEGWSQSHIDIITKVSEKAGKEFQIEQALDKMAREWEGVALEVVPYRETGTYVLRGVDDLQANWFSLSTLPVPICLICRLFWMSILR